MWLCAYLQLYYHHGFDFRFHSKLATQLQLMYVHIKVYKYVANLFYQETIIIYVYISAYIATHGKFITVTNDYVRKYVCTCKDL